MKSPKPEKDKKKKDKIIKDVINLFRLQKEIYDTAIKNIKKSF